MKHERGSINLRGRRLLTVCAVLQFLPSCCSFPMDCHTWRRPILAVSLARSAFGILFAQLYMPAQVRPARKIRADVEAVHYRRNGLLRDVYFSSSPGFRLQRRIDHISAALPLTGNPALRSFYVIAMTALMFGVGWLSRNLFEKRLLSLKPHLPYFRDQSQSCESVSDQEFMWKAAGAGAAAPQEVQAVFEKNGSP